MGQLHAWAGTCFSGGIAAHLLQLGLDKAEHSGDQEKGKN
jgi:hypothetical protein